MARNIILLDGQRFGMLVVIERAAHKGTDAAWLCRCDCGGTKVASSRNLRYGDTRSCGCMGRGRASKLSPSGRIRRDKAAKKFIPPPPVPLPCYTCARWLPLTEGDLGGYCEAGLFLIAKPHLGSCAYKC